MSVIDDTLAAISANRDAIASAVAAFAARDARIADLVAQLAAAGEISAAAAQRLVDGIAEIQTDDAALAAAVAAGTPAAP